MIEKNYHTHLYRCKHGTGDVDDYCRAALGHGLTVLGISDHAALPDNRWIDIRMDFSELEEYCESIDSARKTFPDLTVLKSMECEFAEEYVSYYREELLGARRFDYLIGGIHLFPFRGEWTWVYGSARKGTLLKAYADFFIQAMQSGLFAFMAHPDLFGSSYLRWDTEAEACSRDIFSAAEALRMPLEINGYGFLKPWVDSPDGRRPMYPWKRFWEVASEYEVTVVVNSDAHFPEKILGGIPEGLTLAHECGLPLVDLSARLPRTTTTSPPDPLSTLWRGGERSPLSVIRRGG